MFHLLSNRVATPNVVDLPSRRAWIQVALSGAGSWLAASIADPARAQGENRRRGSERSLIVLWMNGGPSQMDTFDLKPNHSNGGEFRPIATSTPGVQICEHLPKLAEQMKHVALIRSMTSKEGSHERGRYLAQTGYLPAGGLQHPAFGAIASSELGVEHAAIPNYVTVNLPSLGSGFLGMQHAAFHIPNPELPPPNTQLAQGVPAGRFDRRLRMLSDLESDFISSRRGSVAADHASVTQQSVRLMQAKELAAFDVAKEPPSLRDAYGRTPFGQGCLLARRLVEQGTPSIQVSLNGWDTHVQNFAKNKQLMGEFDPAVAALINDLRERGLFDQTLIVCLGEFGRTPQINRLGGRDHWPKTWSALLAGAGIQGGQVVGATSVDGMEIARRPVSVSELYATSARALKIPPTKENVTPNGRPIAIVDGASAVGELF